MMKITKFNQCVSVLLCLTLFGLHAAPLDHQSDREINGKSPEEIIAKFQITPPDTAKERFTLALAFFGTINFRDSIDWANRALAGFDGDEEKALCYELIAQSYGALGDLERAANAATEGLRLQPESKRLASIRLSLYAKMEDPLNTLIAKEHLKQLDPSFNREPVLEPITVGIIVLGVVCVATATAIVVEEDPEAKKQLTLAFVALAGAAKIVLGQLAEN